ncbi:hypothetical protein A5893_09870 [Pedobacter psychrophilus]|uniref:Uncharacterized protein n=1 Tax=Pedobacter psychrophilus TaxID=1826909 RepID=A0A179DFN9_9SPHI|nr:hypothetical protein [Pedobacter psychrophilus]OAQ39866.1 hypothetical protein A5893_09870 [Pedobacter psychrophilus]
MKQLLLLLFFFTFLKAAQSQTKLNTDTLKVYEFSVSEYPQKVKLVEFQNKSYKGLITTPFYQGRFTNNGFFKRLWKNIWNNQPTGKIIDSIEISPRLTMNLMNELKLEGIETIKDCEDDKDCNDRYFLDGSSVSFKISTDSLKRSYGFKEIHPNNSNNTENTELRNQAQKLVTTIYESLNFKYQFEQSKERLPKGYYFYIRSGNSFIEFYSRKGK